MPWIRSGDGLSLRGGEHYNRSHIATSISELRKARNQPGTVCKMLDELIDTGHAPRSLVYRLSKWCDWSDPSERVARSIANQLFYGIICPRLLDQQNKPIPD